MASLPDFSEEKSRQPRSLVDAAHSVSSNLYCLPTLSRLAGIVPHPLCMNHRYPYFSLGRKQRFPRESFQRSAIPFPVVSAGPGELIVKVRRPSVPAVCMEDLEPKKTRSNRHTRSTRRAAKLKEIASRRQRTSAALVSGCRHSTSIMTREPSPVRYPLRVTNGDDSQHLDHQPLLPLSSNPVHITDLPLCSQLGVWKDEICQRVLALEIRASADLADVLSDRDYWKKRCEGRSARHAAYEELTYLITSDPYDALWLLEGNPAFSSVSVGASRTSAVRSHEVEDLIPGLEPSTICRLHMPDYSSASSADAVLSLQYLAYATYVYPALPDDDSDEEVSLLDSPLSGSTELLIPSCVISPQDESLPDITRASSELDDEAALDPFLCSFFQVDVSTDGSFQDNLVDPEECENRLHDQTPPVISRHHSASEEARYNASAYSLWAWPESPILPPWPPFDAPRLEIEFQRRKQLDHGSQRRKLRKRRGCIFPKGFRVEGYMEG